MKLNKQSVPKIANKEALKYLENKIILPTKHWNDIKPKAHARAFMVTGAMKHDLLIDIHSAIYKDIKNGGTLKEFRSKFDDICAKRGWQPSGNKDHRVKVIYNTNINMAYSAGREAKMQELKHLRPYAEYVSILDVRTRASHRELHGQVHHLDSAFWDIYTPPNGWLCRCVKRSLSKEEIEAYSYKIEPSIDNIDSLPKEIKPVRTNGAITMKELPKGVDYGFDYNPGKAAFGQILDKASFDSKRNLLLQGQSLWKNISKGDYKTYGRINKVPIDVSNVKPLKPLSKGLNGIEKQLAIKKTIKESLKMKEDIEIIPTKAGLMGIDSEMLASHIGVERYVHLSHLKEVLEEPFEIWQSFEENKMNGKVEIRQRFIKVIKTDKERPLLFIASSHKGQITGWTFIRKNTNQLNKERAGKLIYGRK